jgi:tetratricopeptide (TPR) repeat protein
MMATKRIGPQIEELIADEAWGQAQTVIEKQLAKEPHDHWLWSRLSAVKYEQRDYQGALADAEKALEIVPDCPLAQWDYAGALDMLGRPKEALAVYRDLFHRGDEQLETPDEDAEECWEGKEWTAGLITDCAFRAAGCLAKLGDPVAAEDLYRIFLAMVENAPGIYSRKDAEARLKKLQRQKAVLSPKELRQKVMELVGA